jgi:phthiocerol/phenolphthiocerol synthesis type-I polyketide synthase E
MIDKTPLDKRLATLTPERRRLLEKLTSSSLAAVTPAVDPPAVKEQGSHELRLDAPVSVSDTKRLSREFYNNVSLQLDSTPLGEHAMFLNYGYASTEAKEYSPINLPAQYLNRNAVKLVLELIGTVELNGLEVFDAGCGRGGTAYVINRYFNAKRFVGLDLAPEAINYCCRTHRYPGFSFQEGDTEHLPFGENEFDVVTNIESSHNYPDVFAFYIGVHKVLRPGGSFLHTDNVSIATWEAGASYLRGLGMTLEHERDITANVLLSCDQTAQQHRQAFQPADDPSAVDTFLAVPGSPIYDDMKNGSSAYRILHWRKAG